MSNNDLKNTAAIILGKALKNLYPTVKFASYTSDDNGFYLDFDLETVLKAEDLDKIQAELDSIVKGNLSIDHLELSKNDAVKLMDENNEPYESELIKDLDSEAIQLCRLDNLVLPAYDSVLSKTAYCKAVKLMSVSGAYFKGNEKNKMLQRISGVAFKNKTELKDYLTLLEEAKKRDHRKLGKELRLFEIMDEGPGFPFFLPNGVALKNALIDYWRELHRKNGYIEIETPIILNRKLWETSGHWFHYKENMYTLKIDDEDYAIKPMNCPGGMLVYKTEMHSYRDFPIRAAEMGRVHRHELSGALHGLMRARAFTQDDAHIFMLPEQIKDEIIGVIHLIHEIYSRFGFKYRVELSTRPENSMGSDEEWNMAEASLKAALDEVKMDYKVNEGDGAFYGPKIDFHLEDSLGRSWQCGTIQLDFQLPQRFDLTYVGSDGEKHRPIVIHRAILGSIERFIAILIEHFDGKFPVWLSPVQVKVLPISEKFLSYGKSIAEALQENGIRASLDGRLEKIGYKIREARNERVPYIVVVGEKELEDKTISLRSRANGEEGSLKLEDFISRISHEIKERSL